MASDLSVSIVLYRSDRRLLADTLSSLEAAAERALGDASGPLQLFLIDNNAPRANAVARVESGAAAPWPGGAPVHTVVVSGQGNVGYGAGHNLALGGSGLPGRYHLILNPDVELAPEALAAAIGFMDRNPDCGLLSPAAIDAGGSPVSLCRRYPTVFDLLLRGFAPDWLRRPWRRRLARYAMTDRDLDALLWDPPLVSGCFMLFRSELLQRLGGFDPRYFLYFEDFDLSLRAAAAARIASVPAVRIVHHGGGAARKGWAHVRMYAASMLRFFGKHGWRWA
ncbi:MAG: glycosyltransferase [Burkholderiales bacterium]|nr:MAG: glycosyltransferase [Burkholderiales bacterium]